ncbi:AIPR family protein [Bifidobacterium favimelis]|uniref:AIPR family protein n=1 Tax=Bifidobacterium favimelis TaxID=3122979 RepID=A0ABU8ZQP8_9BIFI
MGKVKRLPDEEVAYNYFKAVLKEDNQDCTGQEEDQAFESFSAHLVLKGFSLPYTAVEDGIVGGNEDGGIDSLFALLNGQLLPNGSLDEIDTHFLSKRTPLDLYFIQSKNSFSWRADVWPKMGSALKLLLSDLSQSPNLHKLEKSGLSDGIKRFAINLNETRHALDSVMPLMRVHCIYVSFGSRGKLSELALSRGDILKNAVKKLLPTDSVVEVDYWDCIQIVRAGSQSANHKVKLHIYDQAIIENDLKENENGKNPKNFVALVTLENYLNFIQKKGGNGIDDDMFEENVRGYAGHAVDVNKAIQKTLTRDSDTHFWWLNNGITILADETYDNTNTEWVIENPLIVNGLQTSYTLYDAFAEKTITAKRLQEYLLVRVITSKDEGIRQDIITGTNNQNSIKKLQLHANDELQIRIENYLAGYDWYYERRKYQYKNSHKPQRRIRNLTELSQAVMAYRLLEPDQARARPTTFLNKSGGKGWDLVFPANVDITLYLKALQVQDKVDTFLKTPEALNISSDSTNARFYLNSCYTLQSSNVKSIDGYKQLPVSALKDKPSDNVLKQLLMKFVKVSKNFDSSTMKNDQLYKSTEFRDKLFEEILNG